MQSVVKGCDPELFLIDEATGNFISSVGLIGGSKVRPKPIDDEGNAVQEDNVTVEFNIPPCKTSADFVKHINKNKEWIKERAEMLGFGISIKPSAVFSDSELNSREARTFGCEPDFNAWENGAQNPRPYADNPNLRSCGGHIHITLEPEDDLLMVVKAMDLFVGCMMLEFDHDKDRRQLYGKAGAFRKKSYGVEYRTASNAWIMDDEKIQWAWDQTDKAVEFVRSGGTFTEQQGEMIQRTINNSDMEMLAALKKEFGLK